MNDVATVERHGGIFVAQDGRLRASWRFVLSVVVIFVANFLGGGIAFRLTHSSRISDAIYRATTMLLLVLGFSILLTVADKVPGSTLADMGLGTRPGWLRESAFGVVLGMLMVTVAVGFILIFGRLGFTLALITRRVVGLVLLELFTLVTAAMMEELMFRGYPFQRVVEALGPAPAVAVLSLLFGGVHLSNPHASVFGFLNTVAVGVLLSLAYLRTRALWLPWGIHFGWNTALGLFFGLPVSGLNQFGVVVRGTAAGPAWVTGGSYGIEASAQGTFVIVLGIAALLALVPRREEPLAGAPSAQQDAAEQSGIQP